MLKELLKNLTIFDQVRTGQIWLRVAVIDPGTNMAIRYCIFSSNGRGGVMYRPISQFFFRGDLAGVNYVERMAVMSSQLLNSDIFKTVDLYIVEKQFETNVELSVGVIVGIISLLRAKDLVLKEKRSGNVAPESLSYQIMTVPAKVKKTAIEAVIGKLAKGADLKEGAKLAAHAICERDGDAQCLEMLRTHAKNDDIADTVCYVEGIVMCINSIKQQ